MLSDWRRKVLDIGRPSLNRHRGLAGGNACPTQVDVPVSALDWSFLAFLSRLFAPANPWGSVQLSLINITFGGRQGHVGKRNSRPQKLRSPSASGRERPRQ